MKVIYNSVIPFKGFAAINLFGRLYVRAGAVVSVRLFNHEKIHTAQMREMLYVFFYIFYVIEWFLKLFRYGKSSYHNIGFEREAYENERDSGYLKKRKRFAWIDYL